MRVFLDVPGQCSEESEWQCLDKKSCIDKRRRCDGYGDCADLSDEDQQLCSNGILVSLVLSPTIYHNITKLTNHKKFFYFLKLIVLNGSFNVLTESVALINEGVVMVTTTVLIIQMSYNVKVRSKIRNRL